MAGVALGIVLAALGLHHGEADPTLLQWIMQALNHVVLDTLGFTELTVVIIIGLIILAMPAGIVLIYWASTRRAAAVVPGPPVARRDVPAVVDGEE